MTTALVLLVMLVAWVALNIFAPYATLMTAERISTGRLPAELLIWPKDKEVRFYITTLKGGYGFSVWAPPHNIVIFDRLFFRYAHPQLIRYVVAHELAHFNLGHHKKRWWCVVTGAVLFPSVRRRLREMEDEADQVAEKRTGLSRSLFPELSQEAVVSDTKVKTMEQKARREGETKVVVSELQVDKPVAEVPHEEGRRDTSKSLGPIDAPGS